MRIGLVMFYDDHIKSYGDINYYINTKYCEKYNLQIILSNTKKYTERHSAWERLPLILEHISQFDYLIWIDADAFFYHDANDITNIIKNNMDVDFIFSKDLGNKNINTGIFIVKNSKYSIEFLTKWAYDEELYINNKYPYWWDQGVLIDMVDKNILNINQHSKQFDYGVLQHFDTNQILYDKPYIFHAAGKSADIRYSISLDYYFSMLKK